MIKEHALLKNKVYMYLLVYYNQEEMPSYTVLGQKLGLTRQTISKKVKDLIERNLLMIDEDNLIDVENVLDLDVGKLRKILSIKPTITPVELEQILFFNKDKNEILKKLDMSNGSYYNNLKSEVVVYGIVSEGIVKYVGCTKHYQTRIMEHISKRPFLKEDNFIILKRVDVGNQFDYERQLISILQPEWNIVK